MVKNNYINEALVYHERFKPFNHRFYYKMFYLKFPVDKLDEMKNAFFSLDKFNLFSFYTKDYLDGSSRPLRQKIIEIVAPENVKAAGEIVLQTSPRVLGYGFNPVSFWYIYDENQKLEAILAEVNNTFGDRHYYLMHGFGEFKKIATPKVFHVSPFFDIEGQYEFSFTPKNVDIDYLDKKTGDYFFKSAFTQIRTHEFSAKNLLKMFFRYPFMTFFVTGRIHWQAFKLYLKKAQFFTRPVPPEKMLTKEVKS